MARAPPLPADPLWKLELASVRVYCGNVSALYNWLCARVAEQGFQVTKSRPAKGSLKISTDDGGERPLVAKIRLYELDPGTGRWVVEWRRRWWCCRQSEADCQALRSKLAPALVAGSAL